MAELGKVIIVTGASRGIGLAATHHLLKQKCRLVVVARSADPLERLRKDWPEQVKPLTGDLTDFSLAQRAVELAIKTWNHLDGVIVNHGVLKPIKRLADVQAEEWREAFDINVFSAVALIKAALPELRKARGKIILTSSGAAINAYSTWGAYGATKAALNHLALTLAVEEPDVTTLSIRPGVVDTDMQKEIREVHHASMDKQDVEKFRSLKNESKLLRPDQPGNVIARLALDAPPKLNGQFLTWDDNALASFQEG